MNQLDSDIFAHIAAHLENDMLTALELWYGPLIKKTLEKNVFWYERTEIFLKTQIKWRLINYKEVYEVLQSAIKIQNKAAESGKTISLISSVILSSEDPLTVEIIKILLEIGHDPRNGQYPETGEDVRSNALITAIHHHNFKTAEFLLIDGRINTQAKTPDGLSALLLACSQSYNAYYDDELVSVIKLLLENPGEIPDYRNNRALLAASNNGYTRIVELLVTHGKVDPSEPDNDALREAISGGHLETAIFLLENPKVKKLVRRTDNDSQRLAIRLIVLVNKINDALVSVSKYGNTELLQLLLNNSADPGFNNNTAIALAAKNGHIGVVKLLMSDNRVYPAANHNKAIRYAANNGYIDVVKLLLTNNKVSIFGNRKDYTKAFKNPEFVAFITEKVRDSLSGLVAATTFVGLVSNWQFNGRPGFLYTIPKGRNVDDTYTFYTDFQRFLIRNKAPLLETINELTETLIYENDNINKAIYYAAKYVLDTNEGKSVCFPDYFDNWSREEWDLYTTFKGFFLLCFEPKYSLQEIFKIMNSDVATSESINEMAGLLGPYLGLQELINMGLVVTDQMNKNINKVLSWDISLLYD